MEIRPDRKLRRIHEHIRFYFDFLFRRGFQIASVLFIDQNNESWQVILMAQECLVKIYSDKGTITLTLGTQQSQHEINLLDLVDLIQHANGGEDFFYLADESQTSEMQRLKQTACLLENYIHGFLIQIKRHNLFSLNRSIIGQVNQQNRAIV